MSWICCCFRNSAPIDAAPPPTYGTSLASSKIKQAAWTAFNARSDACTRGPDSHPAGVPNGSVAALQNKLETSLQNFYNESDSDSGTDESVEVYRAPPSTPEMIKPKEKVERKGSYAPSGAVSINAPPPSPAMKPMGYKKPVSAISPCTTISEDSDGDNWCDYERCEQTVWNISGNQPPYKIPPKAR